MRPNYGGYGVRKMLAAVRRDGVDVGRDQVGRLMRELGLQGVRRGSSKRTIVSSAGQSVRPADLVGRNFSTQRPDQLWVCDLTYLAIVLTAVIYALKKVRPFDGFHPAVMLLLYSPVRFLLDYLRREDK